jgi:glycosyltransferase involved in cell wall biosynthesis
VRSLDQSFDVTILAMYGPGEDTSAYKHCLRGRLFLVSRTKRIGKVLTDVWNRAPVGYARYTSSAMQSAMTSLLRSEPFDLVHFDHLHTAQLLPLVREEQPNALAVIDAHNVESTVVERVAGIAPFPKRRILAWQARRVKELEAHLVASVTGVLCCSEVDASILRSFGARRVRVVPNGALFDPGRATLSKERRDVVFVGSMDWWPNADAATVLVREIWPLFARSDAHSRLVLVGRNPPAAVRSLRNKRVQVTGTVPDVEPFLDSAFATAMPIRAGSGTRVKILEAAAARVPIVCTRLASEGLPLEHGRHLLHAETPREFSEALLRLKREPQLGRELANRAFDLALQCDWRRIGQSLGTLYRSWCAALTPSAPRSEQLSQPFDATSR